MTSEERSLLSSSSEGDVWVIEYFHTAEYWAPLSEAWYKHDYSGKALFIVMKQRSLELCIERLKNDSFGYYRIFRIVNKATKEQIPWAALV